MIPEGALQAAHEPTRGEVVGRHFIVQALQYDEVGMSPFGSAGVSGSNKVS